jgi:substrate import-associated zinc metallohydrolase lipoprotein
MKCHIFLKITLVTVLSAAVWSSCKKETVNLTTPPPGLGGDTWVEDATDKFIYDSLTVPYNIAVYYKWVPGMLDFPSNIVPPEAEKVVPMLKAILAVAFAPYNQQTGSTVFLRKYLPKTYKLAGSAEYLSNGAIFLGQAEGGTAMLLFQVNYFTRKTQDSAVLKEMVHTMHHEFGHILHQNVLYPVAFKNISIGYTGTWFNSTDAEARAKGFITAYAQSAPDEDFVEMVSTMLAGANGGPNGYDDYEALLAQTGGPGTKAYADIKAKEAIVVDYFAKVWNIDFYALQRKCRLAFKGYLQ